jgi:hypothetical protein
MKDEVCESKARGISFWILVLSVLLFCFALVGSATLAYAGSASGATSSSVIGGKTYMGYNSISTSSGSSGTALAQTHTTSTTSSPSGYLGAAPMLYKDSTLVVTGYVSYSSGTYSAGSYFSVLAIISSGASGNYNCYGKSYGYNSTSGSYTAFYPPRSPNQTV